MNRFSRKLKLRDKAHCGVRSERILDRRCSVSRYEHVYASLIAVKEVTEENFCDI